MAQPMPTSHSPSRVAPGAGLRRLPAEPFGAGAPSLDDMARREGQTRGRVLVRLVEEAQLDRIDAERVCQFVDARIRARRCRPIRPVRA